MPDWIALLLALLAALGPPAAVTGGQPLLPAAAIAFQPRSREVTNWRLEAVRHLDLDWRLAGTLAAGRDAARVSRCVRLNNYWCIKRAGWAGEIAADGEDHVAFASAMEGADVAALLLRRYYIDLRRHSAMEIVSRWAPAACGAPLMANRAPAYRRIAQPDHLATRGLGNTLRARFLASRGGHVSRGRRSAGRLRRSVVPDRIVALLPAPAIAVGLGERPPSATGPAALLAGGSLSAAAMAAMVGAPVTAMGATPVMPCVADTGRIRSYAEHAAAGIAPTIHDDLKLFAADGRPTANLARMMLNMAAVEIGPLGARPALAADAVAHLAVRPAVPTTAAR